MKTEKPLYGPDVSGLLSRKDGRSVFSEIWGDFTTSSAFPTTRVETAIKRAQICVGLWRYGRNWSRRIPPSSTTNCRSPSAIYQLPSAVRVILPQVDSDRSDTGRATGSNSGSEFCPLWAPHSDN